MPLPACSHFDQSQKACGGPLCDGVTITVEAEIYSRFAISTEPKGHSSVDGSCQKFFGPRNAGKPSNPKSGHHNSGSHGPSYHHSKPGTSGQALPMPSPADRTPPVSWHGPNPPTPNEPGAPGSYDTKQLPEPDAHIPDPLAAPKGPHYYHQDTYTSSSAHKSSGQQPAKSMGTRPASYYYDHETSQQLPERSDNALPPRTQEDSTPARNPSDQLPDAHGSQQLPEPEVNGIPKLPDAPKSPYYHAQDSHGPGYQHSDYYGHTEYYPERSSQILPEPSVNGIPPRTHRDNIPDRSPADQLPDAHGSQQLPDPEVKGIPDPPAAPKGPHYYNQDSYGPDYQHSDYYGHTERYSSSYPERSSQILPERSDNTLPPRTQGDNIPDRNPTDQLPDAHGSQLLPKPEVNGIPKLPDAPKSPYYGRRLSQAAGAEPVKTAALAVVPEDAEPTYITDHAAKRQVARIQKASPSYDTSGYFGGWATVIKGVITSVDGIKTDRYRVKDGMIEHVSSFNGRPLSAVEYKALSHKLPLITPGSYTIDLPTEH